MHRVLQVGGLLLLPLLTGCRGEAAADATQAAEPAAQVIPVAAEPAAPVQPEDLTVELVGSAAELKERIAALQGKTVVVNFWATWCPPCVEEFPHLVELQKNYADQNVVLLTASHDDAADLDEKVKPFLTEHGVKDHAVLVSVDDEAEFIDAWDKEWSGEFPTTWIFKPDGTMLQRLQGEKSYDEFEQALKEALANPDA